MKVVWHHRVQAEDGQAVHIRSLASAFEGPGHAVEEVALVEKTGRADPAKGEATAHDGDERRALPCSLEVLTDGEDCLLFPPGDGAALNRALGRLAADGSLRETPGAAARAAVEERDLTWEGNARRVVSGIELIDK